LKKFDVIVIGDANIDLIVVGGNQVPAKGQEIFVDNMLMNVGGGAALFAISLAKLGLRVAFNGILGDDHLGRFIREEFALHGIDTSFIKTSAIHHTGISIAFNTDSDRSFISYAGSNQELRMDHIDLEEMALGGHVHITGYKGRSNHERYLTAIKRLKERGLTLSCDVGWDDTEEWYEGVFELMSHMDVFFMNETEAHHYTRLEKVEDCLRYMGEYGKQVVIKLGARGAAAVMDGVQYSCTAYPVRLVDTTGAGDSFNSGYLYGFLSGLDIAACLKYGNASGALSVGAYGGSTGAKDLAGLEDFIREHDSELSQSQTVAHGSQL
jgi:sugar/nucleoside kinase (ribokinase family)